MSSWTTERDAFRTFLLMSQLDPAGIRARIREARRERGLTQQELADLLEVHKRTVENYENSRAPDYKALNRIARVLDRPVEWFLHGESEDQPTDEQMADLRAEVGEIRTMVERLLAAVENPPA